MPKPVDRQTTYRPGLDGVRALAVGLVILFHLGVSTFRGGLLGVGIFFTLSGYLITGLLVSAWQRRRSLGLKAFWLRRARRLLPAVITLLITGMIVVLLVARDDLDRRLVEALGALCYVANWHTIAAGDSYFAQVHGPGPFDHLWSLAVEEQFYVGWPLLLGLLILATRGRMKVVAAITAVLAAGSFVLLAVLAQPGMDNTRAYEGTDTRAGGLLVGAVLALAWSGSRAVGGRPSRMATAAGQLAGLAGLAGIAWLVTHTDEDSLSLYRWGLLLLSVCTAALLVAVADSKTPLGRLFSLSPLRWLGERSYGLYLWHLPVIVFTPQDVLADHQVVRDVLQVVIAVVLAAASWRFIENPIRTRGLAGALRSARGAIRREGGQPTGRRSPALVLGASVFLPVAVLAMLFPRVLPREEPVDLAEASPVPVSAPPGSHTEAAPIPTPTPTPSPATATATVSSRTSCRTVFLIGDSTSEGLYGKTSVLSPQDDVAARLRKVGVQHFTADISGARSIIETYQDDLSGQQVVRKQVAGGYHGCWIISLGNVDAATVKKYAPDTTSIPDRITAIMSVIPNDQPVMWLTTRTMLRTGDFPADAYPPWNQALVNACDDYPNMHVFDWASAYRTGWIGPDGIHSTPTGYRHKAHLIARALAIGVPAAEPAPQDCAITVR